MRVRSESKRKKALKNWWTTSNRQFFDAVKCIAFTSLYWCNIWVQLCYVQNTSTHLSLTSWTSNEIGRAGNWHNTRRWSITEPASKNRICFFHYSMNTQLWRVRHPLLVTVSCYSKQAKFGTSKCKKWKKTNTIFIKFCCQVKSQRCASEQIMAIYIKGGISSPF